MEAKLIKDGKVLPIKDVDVVIQDDKVVFKIKKPSREQSGPYQIKLSNGQGEDVKDCNITMQDVPTPPQDVDVTEVFQTNCKVSWKPPKDDGGSPIMHYVVERQDLSLKGKVLKNNEVIIPLIPIFTENTYRSILSSRLGQRWPSKCWRANCFQSWRSHT